MKTIFRKELADFFTSFRFMVVLALALLISAATLYSASKGIRSSSGNEFVFLSIFTTQNQNLPSYFGFVDFLALFLMPIIGISLGFDAIAGERASGTLSRVLSQPIHRDSVILAKFLAGLVVLTVVVLVTVTVIGGYGLRMIGVPPSGDEVLRLFFFMGFSVIYGAFWMGLALLFSIFFRRTATSLLTSVGLWLFFGFFYIYLIAPAVANALAPTTDGTVAAIVHNTQLEHNILLFSPNYLFLEASSVLVQPPLTGSLLGLVGVIASGMANWLIAKPLSLGRTLMLVWPHLISLVSLMLICFGISYVKFMRQEIRVT